MIRIKIVSKMISIKELQQLLLVIQEKLECLLQDLDKAKLKIMKILILRFKVQLNNHKIKQISPYQ
jgi:hypothetical protein